ncbi:MAG: hypothetical protein ABI867_02540 [Kofleriaceae bacterium]
MTAIHISVASSNPGTELARIQERIEGLEVVEDRGELEALLCRRLARSDRPAKPTTLDFIGHSSPEHSLLTLGTWVIDTERPAVRAFFRELADQDVLPRLNVRAVRLLGCGTAETARGRATLCTLAQILEVEVYGTTETLGEAHYDAHGLRDDCGHVLVAARSFASTETIDGIEAHVSYRRNFDIELLPPRPITAWGHAWPLRVLDRATAAAVVRLVRRGDGAEMPGDASDPMCELALPATTGSRFHFVQVLRNGELVRVFPDGTHRPGVVFPVTDPAALCALLAY